MGRKEFFFAIFMCDFIIRFFFGGEQSTPTNQIFYKKVTPTKMKVSWIIILAKKGIIEGEGKKEKLSYIRRRI